MSYKNEITDNVKEQTRSGILQVITYLFDALLKPIIDGIGFIIKKIANFFRRKAEDREMRASIEDTLAGGLIKDYLDTHGKSDCIIFKQHNGGKMNDGSDFKYIRAIYTDIDIETNNHLLKELATQSIPKSIVNDILLACHRNTGMHRGEFEKSSRIINSFFKGYNYVYFHTYRNMFYVIMTDVEENFDYNYLHSLIDKLKKKL
jgi:hypothetical protein